VTRLGDICGAPNRQDRESGQAMVEFVLVLLPFIIFVGGIVQLGIGIANWHDLNRIANEGARYAAVNEWPNCPSGLQPCTGNPVCHPADPADLNGRSLANYLRCEADDAGLPGVIPVICRPGANAGIGDPISVRLGYRINFLSADSSDVNKPHKVDWLGVNMRGEATMRIESTPSFSPVACP
jgi:hypothetical protein